MDFRTVESVSAAVLRAIWVWKQKDRLSPVVDVEMRAGLEALSKHGFTACHTAEEYSAKGRFYPYSVVHTKDDRRRATSIGQGMEVKYQHLVIARPSEFHLLIC